MAGLLLSLFLSSFILSISTGFTQNYDQILHDLIITLTKLVGYYNANFRNINLDGLFGLRIVEGELSVLLSQHQHVKDSELHGDIWKQIRKLQVESSRICQLAIPYVRQDNEAYYEQLKQIILNTWRFSFPVRRLNHALVWKAEIKKRETEQSIKEEDSDRCMQELLGTKCNLSDSCLTLISERGYSEYSITHQVLYVLLAIKMDCVGRVDGWLRQHGFSGGTDELVHEFCVNNYVEMLHMLRMANFKISGFMQDLFMEEQFVCPSFGYVEFLRPSMLQQIMSWQMSSGCYGDIDNTGGNRAVPSLMKTIGGEPVKLLRMKRNLDNNFNMNKSLVRAKRSVLLSQRHAEAGELGKFSNLDKELRSHRDEKSNTKDEILHVLKSANYQKTNDSLKSRHSMRNSRMSSQPSHLGKDGHHKRFKSKLAQPELAESRPLVGVKLRKLLREKEMPDGCLVHKTAVAAGALVMYLRYLLIPGPAEFYNISLLAQINGGGVVRPLATQNKRADSENNQNDSGKQVQPNLINQIKPPNKLKAHPANQINLSNHVHTHAASQIVGSKELDTSLLDEEGDENDELDDDNGEERGGEMDEGKDEIYDLYDNAEDFKVDSKTLVDLKEHPFKRVQEANDGHDDNTYADDYNYYVKPEDEKKQNSDSLFKEAVVMKKLKSSTLSSGYVHVILVSFGLFLLYMVYRLAKKRRIRIRYPSMIKAIV